ncbi:complex I subunit 1 family protein [Pelagicoccus sp. SDUM812003]|uniref:complex I subunit 1/NuoH family protein n=1 Tax=Pelagicoccus sp. SDUM812003 TaxID=3041267 RepID=UPI00280FE290|nr:complex I subunit 1 family protein [Pelagicoccus sp. SDUM812003]MDQ8202649.1 NADH-quinone oxidoreductase subunit H [Pelagicoccus sp. SDUM812003]
MELTDIIIKSIYAIVVVSVLMGFCSYAVLAERKISSWIQGRVGPNRTTLPFIGSIPVVGRFLTRLGVFQPVADGLKFLFKEDVLPGHVNKLYFTLAPVIALIPALTTVVVVPFGYYENAAGEVVNLVLADLNVGILFLFAVSSLGVYGVVLGGWASNSKYPFLGGIRASAQMISYELAMGISVLPIFMWVNAPGTDGSLSLVDVVNAQAGGLWFAMWMPFSFIIFVVCVFAETNRLPFDMAESETELVSGFHTEYSSFKFGLFFVGEYAHMLVGSAVVAVLFLGGWQPLPFMTWADLGVTGIWAGIFSVSTLLGKLIGFMFFFMWIRWTLPRFRYDQIMKLGWQMLLPASIANLVLYTFIIYFIERP